jgi:carboxyl-terminal processing protease
VVLSALVLISASLVAARDPQQAMSATASAYLDEVLGLMQKEALHRDSINWTEVRRETLVRATNAKTTLDTYPAIAYALSQLQEHHSSLDLPDSLPAEQKETIRAQMKKVASSRRPPLGRSPFATRKEIEGHIDHLDGMSFAHLVVPMCVGQYTDEKRNATQFQRYADKLHGLVVDLQAQRPNGWIVDLRGNLGGNMWPMLAGIGLVAGEGDLGSFQSPGGKNESWYYRDGKAGSRSQGQDSVGAQVKKPPFHLSQLPWVAVLLDRSTASSGEAIAISFAGRPRSRSFGEHTMGFATANDENLLSDGATLYLCSSVEADRTGKRYEDGIDPTVVLSAPDRIPSEEEDAVLRAAEKWLDSIARTNP